MVNTRPTASRRTTRNAPTANVTAGRGSGVVQLTSLGHNVVTDATCGIPAPDASDRIVADALLGPLADNGGPTLTHALQPGSPALDTADPARCPAVDQRGMARSQGSACDAGAYEAAAAARAAGLDGVPQSLPEGSTLYFLPLLQH